jgi:branched-chain amino acid transport system substrate-binding protein
MDIQNSEVPRPTRRAKFGIFAAVCLAALAVWAVFASVGTGKGAAPTATARSANAGVTNYVQYVRGKPGKANPKLSPVKIGWVNNQGGSVIPVGPSATAAAQWAVNWVNRYASGIDGHPLQLSTCFVKNAEQEGLACGQQFLNDRSISVIAYGAVATGAQTIDSTVAGKKPIIMGFSLNPSDVTNPNTYILFVAGNLSVYGWITFGQQYLHAKTAAVIYPSGTGFQDVAGGIKQAGDAAGVKVTLVGFDPNSADLTGALEAAGATTADMFAPIVSSPANCLATAKAVQQLGIDPNKIVGFLDCTQPTIQSQYAGGDYPKWWYGIAQSGDAIVPTSPAGKAYMTAMRAFGVQSHRLDAWYSGMFGTILTIAQFMNEIGVKHITPATIAAKVKAFKGPLAMGPPTIWCGKYAKLPAACGGGDQFFQYQGNGVFKKYPRWIDVPTALQKQLGAKTHR